MFLTLEQYSNSLLEIDNEIVVFMLNQDVCEDDLDSENESRLKYNNKLNSDKVKGESILVIRL